MTLKIDLRNSFHWTFNSMLKFLPFIVSAIGSYCKILKRGMIYIDMYFPQNTLGVYSREDIECFFQLSKRLSCSDPEIQSRSLIL